MTMRTPLRQVRGLGSAKSGTEQWWMERVSAIASLPLSIFAGGFIVFHLGASRADILASMKSPVVAILLAVAVLVTLWHMRLGLRVVIEDYVQGHAAKLAMLLLNGFFTAGLGVVALYAILKMSFAP